MLCTFLKDFSQWAISQTATSQGCPSRSTRPPACSSRGPRPPSSSQPQRLAPIAACAAAPKRANLTFGKLPLGKLDIWEVANCQLGSCIWEIAFGKVPNTFESLQIVGTLKLRVHFYCLRSNFNLCTKLFKNLYIYRKLLYFLKLPVLQSAIHHILPVYTNIKHHVRNS